MRNLRSLGAALVAVSVMLSMVAAAAQAEKNADFWASTGSVKVDSANDGHQRLQIGAGTVTCTSISGHAEYSGTSNKQTATGIAIQGCHVTTLGLSFPVTVTPVANCHFTFTAGTWITASGDATGSVHICEITIDVFTSPHPSGAKRCEFHIPAQTLNGITYTNTTSEGKEAVTLDANNVSISNVTVTDFNTLGCNTHETVTATYNGSLWTKATDVNAARTDTNVTGT